MNSELPTLEEFQTFFNSRATLLETLELSKRATHRFKQPEQMRAKAFVPGSQSSLITNRLCEELQLEKTSVKVNLEAINSASCQITHKCKVKLTTHHRKYEFHLACLVIPKITGHLPNTKINMQNIQVPSNIKLADPEFYLPIKVDILIGGGLVLESSLRRTIQDKQYTTHNAEDKTRLDCDWTSSG